MQNCWEHFLISMCPYQSCSIIISNGLWFVGGSAGQCITLAWTLLCFGNSALMICHFWLTFVSDCKCFQIQFEKEVYIGLVTNTVSDHNCPYWKISLILILSVKLRCNTLNISRTVHEISSQFTSGFLKDTMVTDILESKVSAEWLMCLYVIWTMDAEEE